ncbi:MAG TPA: N-acetylmuramoyl-L-alanine amidase [Conexibacter sp.]
MGAGRARVTRPIRAPRAFDLLGLRWSGRHGTADVAVRVERAGGRWSRWATVPASEDMPARGARHVSGPLWTGRAVGYQLRAARFPRGLAVHFVAVPRPASRAPLAVAAADGGPPIVPRSQWDPQNDCPPRTAPSYGRVDFAIVHHTETLAPYSRAQAPEVVLGICRFHRNGNGWNDIGYNLLVDRFGTVYEGRAGGVEQPVIGAQAGGWNSLSAGIAMIGSYVSVPPPPAAQHSLVQALAWKMSLAGIPATGEIVRPSAGGPENRWPAGANIRFQRISGHRNADSTDCPGGALYALLPRIRAEVAAALPPPTNVLTSSPVGGVVPQGGPATLSGRLALATGRRPIGAPLRLEQRDGTAWTTAQEINTGVDGIWSASVPVTVDSAFRVVSDNAGITSPTVSVKVAAGVGAHVSPQLLRAGRSVTVRGSTSPAKGRVTVTVARQSVPGSTWRLYRAATVTTVAGRYETAVRLGAAGLYRVLVTTRPDADNAAGAAPTRTARVLAARR